jgi:O-antigen/teichoic acid export membrane protein
MTDPAVAEDAQDDGPERSSILRNVAHMLASQVATWSVATVFLIVQPRFLGPVVMGQLRLAFSLWAMAQVLLALGTSEYLTLTIARDRAAGLRLVGTVIVIRLLMFLVASVGFGVYLGVSSAPREFVSFMALYALITLFETLSQAITAAFIGFERMSVPAAANVAARVIGTFAAVTVLLLGGDARLMLAVLTVGQLVGLTMLIVSYRRIAAFQFGRWRGAAWTTVRASSGLLVAGAAIIIYQQIDTVIIAVLVEPEVLGWYSTADTLFGSLLFPITIVLGSIFPVIGRLHIEDPESLTKLLRKTVSVLLVIVVPIGLGTLVVGPQAAELLFGAEFRPSGDVLMVLGPVTILTFGTILFGLLAVATGRQRFWNVVMGIAIAITIPIDLIAVPWSDRTYGNGAIGGAIAYFITELMMVAIGLRYVAPHLINRQLRTRALRIGLSGAALVAAGWPFRDDFIAIPIAMSAAAYLIAGLALRVVTTEERSDLRKLLRRT